MVGGPEDGATFTIPTNGQFIDVILPPAGIAFGINSPVQRVARLSVVRRKGKFVFLWSERVERDR